MKYEDKFIAFIDVLGFKSMVEVSEKGTGVSLAELMENLSELGTLKDEHKFEKYGPTTCPQSSFIDRNLNFKVTQISDCVVVSSEVSPAGVINLVSHCWNSVIKLLIKGIMCRGYITKGKIYHHNNQIIGTGYQHAYSRESGVCAFKLEADERGTPFVEIDSAVLEYINNSTDKCVKEMFFRMVKTEGDSTALFPFKRLSHSFAIRGFGQNFDPDKERESNNNVRTLLHTLKERVMTYVDKSNVLAMSKARHYIKAIDDQLKVCDRTDEIIEKLCSPFPSRRV